jgi:hypothetical protein
MNSETQIAEANDVTLPHASAATAAPALPANAPPGPYLHELLVLTPPLTPSLQETDLPVFIFDTRAQAEEAIRTLNKAGFDVRKLSLIGKGYHSEEHALGFYTVGDRIKAWGSTGAFWGGIWGLLLAPAVFLLPGIGMVALAGPVVAALVGALEGAVVVGGLSALGAALTNMGVGQDDVIKFETALKVDQYVLMVHATTSEIAHVRELLTNAKACQSPTEVQS